MACLLLISHAFLLGDERVEEIPECPPLQGVPIEVGKLEFQLRVVGAWEKKQMKAL